MKRSPIKRQAKAKSAGWWQRKADSVMQALHKYMFNRCMVCGGKNEVGHHFITKSLSSYLRYDFDNLIPLCHSCHFRHHIQADPHISAKIISVKGQPWYERMERIRRMPIKTGTHYFQAMHEKLTKELEKLIS